LIFFLFRGPAILFSAAYSGWFNSKNPSLAIPVSMVDMAVCIDDQQWESSDFPNSLRHIGQAVVGIHQHGLIASYQIPFFLP